MASGAQCQVLQRGRARAALRECTSPIRAQAGTSACCRVQPLHAATCASVTFPLPNSRTMSSQAAAAPGTVTVRALKAGSS